MADTKVTGLAAITDVATTDILYVVDDPGGTPASKKATVQNVVDTGFWHHHLQTALSSASGASGATVVSPNANSVGGWQLNAAGEKVFFAAHVDSDWDGASDPILEVVWEQNAAGTLGTDTVDLKCVFRYKSDQETAIKTQTVEVAKTVGTAAQYTQWTTQFALDWDLVDNVLQVGDTVSVEINLETDTSEVDDVIINLARFLYQADAPGIRQ